MNDVKYRFIVSFLGRRTVILWLKMSEEIIMYYLQKNEYLSTIVFANSHSEMHLANS